MNKVSNLPIVLHLAANPLISYGTVGENPLLTSLGLGAILIDGVTMPALRFAGKADDNAAT